MYPNKTLFTKLGSGLLWPVGPIQLKEGAVDIGGQRDSLAYVRASYPILWLPTAAQQIPQNLGGLK